MSNVWAPLVIYPYNDRFHVKLDDQILYEVKLLYTVVNIF